MRNVDVSKGVSPVIKNDARSDSNADTLSFETVVLSAQIVLTLVGNTEMEKSSMTQQASALFASR